jgi:hypothetical protein
MVRMRGWKAVAAVLCVFTLTATAAACSSGKSTSSGTTQPNSASDIGVTADTIKIGVGVADLDGLRAQGISLAAALTTQNLSKRVTSYFEDWNAAGGINGRTVEPVVLTWDPVKPATQDKFCADATINNEIFAIIVASGLNQKTTQCVVDGGVPMFFGDIGTDAAFATGNLVTISPSVEKMASAGTQATVDAGTIPKGANVGILAGNGPEAVAGTASSKAILEKAGYKTTPVAVDTLQGDTGVSSSESAAAVNTFKAAGVTHVMVLLQFTSSGGFWDGIKGTGITTTILDTASSNCTAFGASRVPASAIGSTCFTVFGDAVTSDGKLRTEDAFEKECRAHYDKVFAGQFPTPSYPGVPSGDSFKLPDGTTVSSDYAPGECTFANLVKMGLEAAGNNPTRKSFMDAVLNLGSVPVALASDGKGTLKPDKPFVADFVHPDVLTAATADTPKNANGTYNNCPVTKNCWVPQSDKWFPIT